MNVETLTDSGSVTEPFQPADRVHEPSRLRSFLRSFGRLAFFGWKYFVGMLCTQSVFWSLFLVGWTNRLTQRTVFKRWWHGSEMRQKGTRFQDFIETMSATAGHKSWPNWIVKQNFRDNLSTAAPRRIGVFSATKQAGKSLSHSLWLNFKVGCQVIFNTWVLTLPGCVFMLFSWRYGWDNSFNKGYEQAFIGPATGLFGIALFIAAMMYLPMAQARQAATEDWRSFYDFTQNWRLVRRRAFWCLALAGLYALLALPANVLKTAPGFFTQGDSDLARRAASMSSSEAVDFLKGYFFWVAAYVFPAYVILRIAAGRIYATALVDEIRYGRIMPTLAPTEREVLARLNLLKRIENSPRFFVKAISWTATRTGSVVACGLSIAVWFVFVAQTYVAEFFNYHAEYGLAWLNHPLVQLPFFQFIPAHLYQ